MPLRDHKPPKLYLTAKQLAAIGRFTARWAYFETEMDFTISALRALQKHPDPIPGGFADRLKYWKRLTHKQFDGSPALKAYVHIIEQLSHGQKWRSPILHGRSTGDPLRRTDAIAFEHHQHKPTGWTSTPWRINPKKLNELAAALGKYASWLKELNRIYLGALGVRPTALPSKYPLSPDAYKNPRPQHPKNGSRLATRLRSYRS